MILLPAVATDAPGTTWQNAMHDTKGSSWFIALASIWALISIFLLSTPILLLLRLLSRATLIGALAPVIVVFAALFIGLVLVALIATRFYQTCGDRLNRPLEA